MFLAARPEDLQRGWLVGRKQRWQAYQLINDKSEIRVKKLGVVYFSFSLIDRHCCPLTKDRSWTLQALLL